MKLLHQETTVLEPKMLQEEIQIEMKLEKLIQRETMQ